MSDGDTIGNAILSSARKENHPDRIVMHPRMADALINEPSALLRIELFQDTTMKGAFKFCGTVVRDDVQHPESSFSFEQICDACSTMPSISLSARPNAVGLVRISGGKWVCAKCRGSGFVRTHTSDEFAI